jgi:hypothetical protein
MVILQYCIRRLPALTPEEFSAYWRGPHAELVKSIAASIGVIHYVQHHSIAPEAARQMIAARGLEEPFDGIAEIGFESFESLLRGNLDPNAAAIQARLAEDEAKFIDFKRSTVLFSQANQVIVG